MGLNPVTFTLLGTNLILKMLAVFIRLFRMKLILHVFYFPPGN